MVRRGRFVREDDAPRFGRKPARQRYLRIRAEMDLKRIQKEIAEIRADRQSGITVRPIGDCLTTLEGTLKGPKDTVYEGGE